MDKIKTGELIKNKRIEKGYTQLELGDLLGVSNKAVSRWENGDSFPDIGVLESLSSLLDLKIQDIVTGEITESDSETSLTELVRMAKLQKRQNLRNTLSSASGMLLLIYMLVLGYLSLSGNNLGRRLPLLHFVSLAGILGWLCYKCRSCKESLKPFGTKQNSLLASLSLLSFFGTIASLCTVLFTLKRKTSLLFLLDKSLGPTCFYLLVALFCVSLVLLAVSLWKHAFREEAFRLDVYVTVATLHLILRYNDMLHTLTSVYAFKMTFLFDTGIVVFLTAVAIGVTALIKSVNRRAAIK